jgi:DNA-binding IclR family transcriptional regulator
LIADKPGIGASEVAKKMKIERNYVYRVLGELEKGDRLKKDGRKYFPAG